MTYFFSGQENDLIIRVAGGNIIQIPTLRVDVVMESGDVIIPDLKLERTDTDFVFKTKFVPPPFPLKLLLKGINSCIIAMQYFIY